MLQFENTHISTLDNDFKFVIDRSIRTLIPKLTTQAVLLKANMPRRSSLGEFNNINKALTSI